MLKTTGIGYKFLVQVILSFCVIGCSSEVNTGVVDRTIDLEKSIGWLHGNCLSIKNSGILNEAKLIIVKLEGQQDIVRGKIVGKANEEDGCSALFGGRRAINLDGGNTFYAVAPESAIDLGIGVVEFNKNSLDEKNVLHLSGGKQKDSFHFCSTAEGIQFSVWSGAPYASHLIWSDYYYLGYDVEANCPEDGAAE